MLRYYGEEKTIHFENSNGTIISNYNHYNAKMVSIKENPFVVGSGSVDRFLVDDPKLKNVQTEMFDRNPQSWEVLQPFSATTEWEIIIVYWIILFFKYFRISKYSLIAVNDKVLLFGGLKDDQLSADFSARVQNFAFALIWDSL